MKDIMRNLKNIFVLSLVFIAFACAQKTESVTTEEGHHFGKMITSADAISYDDLLMKMDGVKEIEEVKVEGKVEKVCQAKGCWMNIVSDDGSKEVMFVKFKDYGFFMPKDISGKTVVMNGRAFKEETSVDELRHYAEDEGKSKEEIEAIKEPKVELKFMADGVILKAM
jgi:hypothetical protein